VRVTFCGVRGSSPAPGPEFVRIGGHTSCVAVAHEDEAPRLLLDAGTGIRRVQALLAGEAFQGTILRMRGDWSFLALEPGRHEVEGFEVLAADLLECGCTPRRRRLPPSMPVTRVSTVKP